MYNNLYLDITCSGLTTDQILECEKLNLTVLNSVDYKLIENGKVSYLIVSDDYHQNLYKLKDKFGYLCYLLSKDCKILPFRYILECKKYNKLIDTKPFISQQHINNSDLSNLFHNKNFIIREDSTQSIQYLIVLGNGKIIDNNIDDNCIYIYDQLPNKFEENKKYCRSSYIRHCIKHPEEIKYIN